MKRPRVPTLSIRSYKKEDGAFHCDKCDFTSLVDKVIFFDVTVKVFVIRIVASLNQNVIRTHVRN